MTCCNNTFYSQKRCKVSQDNKMFSHLYSFGIIKEKTLGLDQILESSFLVQMPLYQHGNKVKLLRIELQNNIICTASEKFYFSH